MEATGGSGGMVYVVEDDPSLLRALVRLAESAGFRVQAFATGAEFLAAPHDVSPACVVLDLRLPDMHGLEVQRRLKRSDPHLSVVILTGYGDELTRREAIAAGAVAFVGKPFQDQILLDTIQGALTGGAR